MIRIITVPAFSDNYIWLICDENKKYAVIVDPGEATPVINTLEESSIEPVAIFITHFHYDHANGISDLLKFYPDIPVYGPASEYELLNNNPQPLNYGPATHCFNKLTHPLKGNEQIHIHQLNASFQVMSVPGHTSGHIAYFHDKEKNRKLFCGDTLFAGGCGRIFDGTFKDLHESLQKISQLPEDTLLYCAHEYTLENLGFAQWVEPDSSEILARIDSDRELIDSDKATVPSLLSLEKLTNPFLRVNQPHVIKKVEEASGITLDNPTDTFKEMRIWKDTKYD